jgi:hypothetical protein
MAFAPGHLLLEGLFTVSWMQGPCAGVCDVFLIMEQSGEKDHPKTRSCPSCYGGVIGGISCLTI